ncbi:MAG: PsbP-related protein [Chitinophagaceae bacterium]
MKIFAHFNLIAFFCLLVAHPMRAQKPITIARLDYSIQAPAGWTIDSAKQMGTDLVIFSMLENATDRFRDNVNVMVQNLAGRNLNLAAFTDLSTKQIKTMAQDGKIETSSTISKGKNVYQKIIYTAASNGFRLKFEQYYFIARTKAYVITLTTEENKFESFRSTGESILNSFVLK